MCLCPKLQDSNYAGAREDVTNLGRNQALKYPSSTAPFRGDQGGGTPWSMESEGISLPSGSPLRSDPTLRLIALTRRVINPPQSQQRDFLSGENQPFPPTRLLR